MISQYRIALLDDVGTPQIEKCLKTHLRASRGKDRVSVQFDVQRTTSIGFYDLTLLALWMYDLTTRGKDVQLTLPTHASNESKDKASPHSGRIGRLLHFLETSGFLSLISSFNVRFESPRQSLALPAGPPDFNPVIGFRQLRSREDLSALLDGIQSQHQLALVFQDTLDPAVIGPQGIRDIVIRELGDNIFDHADGACPILAISLGRLDRLTRMQKLIKARHLPAEAEYFERLGTSNYLEVILADLGKGIPSRLASAYSTDPAIASKSTEKPSEADLLDYAFWFYTTTKRKLHSIEASEDSGRGLYWVRELVALNRGLLSVRSGTTLRVTDFLAPTQTPAGGKREHSSSTTRLSRLGGTQIKILLPLQPRLVRQPRYFDFAGLDNGRLPRKPVRLAKMIRLLDYAQTETELSPPLLHTLLEDISTLFGRPDEDKYVIIDLTGYPLHKDSLLPLLIRLAGLQHGSLAIALFDAPLRGELFSVASNVLASHIETSPLKLRALTLVSDKAFAILGVRPDVQAKLVALASNSAADSKSQEWTIDNDELLSRFSHLVKRRGDRLDLSLTHGQVLDDYTTATQAYLASVIKAPHSGIRLEGKFLLPSNYYVDTFFQVHNLFARTDLERVMDFEHM